MTPKNLTHRLSPRSRHLVTLSLLTTLQFLANYAAATTAAIGTIKDNFHEDLYLKPLADGKLLAHFQFSTLYRKDLKSLRWENHFEIFPLSVADLVATTDLNELHFSLTKGNWNYGNWGYPVRSSPPGAQIRAKFSRHNEDPTRSWQRLVNSLSGKFCASLASADRKTLVETKFSLDHQQMSFGSSIANATSSSDSASGERDHNSGGRQRSSSQNGDRVLYSNLPEETMCTENLTPWKKLLPCYSNSGLASLLNAVNLLKSSYSSLSMDLEPRPCLDKDGEPIEGCEHVHLTQSMSIVFNPLLQFEGRQSWSLAKIFGNSVTNLCPLASHSLVHVDISDLDDRNKLYPQTFEEYSLYLSHPTTNDSARRYATFDLQSILTATNAKDSTTTPSKSNFNLGIKQSKIFKRPAYSSRPSIPVLLRTHIAGLGTAEGTIVATVINKLSEPLRVTYMDVVPYFMRVYLHTLTMRTSSGHELKPDKLNFVLSQEDTPTLIEFSLVLPANSETQISYDFERAFLRWTEFKPDANKGVLLGSTIISVPIQRVVNHLVMPLCKTTHGRLASEIASDNSTVWRLVGLEDEALHVYSKPLLVILPTPDFSMPYNVLCLVCTVLVAAFGPIHNMTTRKPVIKVSKKSLAEKSRQKREDEQKHEQQQQQQAEEKQRTETERRKNDANI